MTVIRVRNFPSKGKKNPIYYEYLTHQDQHMLKYRAQPNDSYATFQNNALSKRFQVLCQPPLFLQVPSSFR